MVTTRIIEAVPMTMPSEVSAKRILLVQNESYAIRKISCQCMRAQYKGSGRRLATGNRPSRHNAGKLPHPASHRIGSSTALEPFRGAGQGTPMSPRCAGRAQFATLSLLVCLTACCWGQSAGDFTIVVLPDTQNYSQFHPEIFDAQTQWVADNAAAQNVQLVIGVGDIVNTGTDAVQWANATHSVGLLDQAKVPYAFAIGNHDYDTLPPTSRTATNFNNYFGPARYAGTSYYGTSNYPAGSNENFYETFTWGDRSYLILVLEFVPRDETEEWAKSVLEASADKEAIVVTHSYLFSDGTTVDQCDSADMSSDNSGAALWDDVIRQYSNISVVLSGHITNRFTARRSDVGVAGNFVHQIFANWQNWTNGGNGYLRIMQFSPSNNTIQVKTYSPFTKLFLTDSGNQFTLTWHNNGASG